MAYESKKKYVLPSALLLKNDAEDINDENVDIYEMIQSEEFSASQKNTVCCLGKTADGEFFYGDVAKFPHLLIAGAVGMGKTTCIYSILTSLLLKATPDEVKFILIDPKGCEMSAFRDIPHLFLPIITNPTQAIATLSFAVDEMENRFDKLEETGARNIDQYNTMLKEGEKPMERIIIVIDELSDLMVVDREVTEISICRLAQKARAAGIHLIISTHRASVDVITGIIKANIPSRIAFYLYSRIDSRAIVEERGAENLKRAGDMLYLPIAAREPVGVRGAYIDHERVCNVAKFWREQGKAEYDDNVLDEIAKKTKDLAKSPRRRVFNEEGAVDSEKEIVETELFKAAVDVVFEYHSASTALLQRKLKIGYAKAARIIDTMYATGLIGEYESQRPRAVLLTKEEYEKVLKGEN